MLATSRQLILRLKMIASDSSVKSIRWIQNESITLDATVNLDTTTTNIATAVGTSSGGECSGTSNEVKVEVIPTSVWRQQISPLDISSSRRKERFALYVA